MGEYALELTIRLKAPKRWKHSTTEIVERILTDKAMPAIKAANSMAENWTIHGEPVEAVVEFREVIHQ